MEVVEKIIAFASWYDGRKEKKGNSGFVVPEFEAEMIKAGWYKGAAWCMFFVILIWRKVFINEPTFYSKIVRQFNGSAKQTADRVVAAGDFETGQDPEPGAICIFLHGHGPAGHAAIVKSVVKKQNTMYNIEGNTNSAGSREGDSVNANKPRTIKRDFRSDGLNVYLYIYPRLKKK